MIRIINSYNRKILYGLTVGSSISFFAFTLLNVGIRYLFQKPILEGIEWSRLGFIWACFMAAALAFDRGVHIAFTFLTDRLPRAIVAPIHLVVDGAVLLLLAILVLTGSQVVMDLWPTHFPISGLSQGYLYLPVPIAGLSMFLFGLENFLTRWQQVKDAYQLRHNTKRC